MLARQRLEPRHPLAQGVALDAERRIRGRRVREVFLDPGRDLDQFIGARDQLGDARSSLAMRSASSSSQPSGHPDGGRCRRGRSGRGRATFARAACGPSARAPARAAPRGSASARRRPPRCLFRRLPRGSLLRHPLLRRGAWRTRLPRCRRGFGSTRAYRHPRRPPGVSASPSTSARGAKGRIGWGPGQRKHPVSGGAFFSTFDTRRGWNPRRMSALGNITRRKEETRPGDTFGKGPNLDSTAFTTLG